MRRGLKHDNGMGQQSFGTSATCPDAKGIETLEQVVSEQRVLWSAKVPRCEGD